MEQKIVLITGAGGPGYPLILKSLRSSERFSYRIIAGELNPLAGNLYHSDWFDAVYQLPPMTAPDYFKVVCRIIRSEKIRFWFSGVDEELSLMASGRSELEALGCLVLLPSAESLDASFDKARTNAFLDGKVPYPRSVVYDDGLDLRQLFSELGKDVVVKACRTRGNRHNYRAANLEEFEFYVRRLQKSGLEFLCQEFIEGEEFNVSLLMDRDGTCYYAVCRQKIDPPRTRPNTFAGIIRRDATMERLAVDTARLLGLCPGLSNVEFVRSYDGSPYVIDVNGGRHAAQDYNLIRSGIHFPEMVIDLAEGNPVEPIEETSIIEGMMTLKFIDEYNITLDDIAARCNGFDLKVE